MALHIVGNNEQHKVPMRFAELRQLQKQNKEKLRYMLMHDALHILPEELWDMILALLFTSDDDDMVAYFAFKRKDTLYNDDHYMFEGVEKDWTLAIAQMRSVVNPDDLQDDIPIDTYCNGALVACPDEFGNRCECRWTHHVFNRHYAFTKYRINIENITIKIRLSKKSYLWNISIKN